jgi:hypothetical protein
MHYKLEEAIEMSCSDLLAIHHRKCIHDRIEISSHRRVMKSLLMGNVYDLCRVKTIITDVLMVKSDMDPHMISRDFGWFGNSSVVRISSWR